MTKLSPLLTRIRRVFCVLFCASGTLWPLRRENCECCRDDEARRQAITAMRDECWRAGL